MPLLHLLRQNPVIAAVKDNASLQLAIDSECQFISVLYGNICTINRADSLTLCNPIAIVDN